MLALAAWPSMAEESTRPQSSPGVVTLASSEESLAPSIATLPKVRRYVKQLVARHDKDKNGYLTADEWNQITQDDLNGDAKVTTDDLIQRIVHYNRSRRLMGTIDTRGLYPRSRESEGMKSTPHGSATADEEVLVDAPSDQKPGAANTKRYYVPPKLLPSGLPSWFATRDRNGDGQLSLAEYAPHNSSGAVATFQQLDVNADGLLTPKECLRAPDHKKKDVSTTATDKK